MTGGATFTLGGGQAALLFLVMMRCTGLVFTAPIFGHHSLPTLVKFGLAASLTVALAAGAGLHAGSLPLLMAAPLEIVIGMSLGFILSMGFEAIEIAGRANSAINVMLATGHLGRILLARGDPGAAGHLDQAVQLARAFAVRPLLAWWLDSLGELAELEGRHGDAQSWYEQAAGHAAECGLAADTARARHHLGRLAWMTGDLASAVNSCHEALAGQLQAGDCLGLAETLETLGGLLIDEGSARRGLPLLAAAAATRERLGFPARPMEAGRIAGWVASGRENLGKQAQPAWERGAGLSVQEAAAMARRGRGPRRRPAFGWPALTPAERNVADLVARGLTNPEIAARLGVSAGTVKGHVSSVLRKLGVRTRAELAAAVSGHSGI